MEGVEMSTASRSPRVRPIIAAAFLLTLPFLGATNVSKRAGQHGRLRVSWDRLHHQYQRVQGDQDASGRGPHESLVQ